MGSDNITVRPGAYYGGLKISGSGNVTFETGVYVFAGGGFEYSGSGNPSGNGVMFYNTFDPQNPGGAGACDEIAIQGSGNTDFTAPSGGQWPNMLWWQDPACSDSFKHAGSGNIGTGIIYLPNAKLDLSGSGNLGSVQIIVDTLDISGSGNQTMTYQSFVETAVPSVSLVE